MKIMSAEGLRINFEYGKPYFNKNGVFVIDVFICHERFTYVLNGYNADGIPILGKEII